MSSPPKSGRVVIAGGAGFLGSHLSDRLLARGLEVVCIDNLGTGRLANIRPLINHRGFRFIETDIAEPLALDGPVDQIFNLACPASPRHYQSDPIATTMTCVVGTANLLKLARSKGAAFLQASTSEVYGDPAVHPQPESYFGQVNPIGPRACYDEGKRCAESLCFDFHRRHGVPVKVARIFNTYGPRMLEDDGRVISNFIVQALSGAPITLYGDGRQTRSFCYVSDLVSGLEKLAGAPESVTGPFNLGNPEEVSVAVLAKRVLRETRSTSPIVFRPRPIDDPTRRRPDITAASEALGWRPEVALAEGLKATIDYFTLCGLARTAARTEPARPAKAGKYWRRKEGTPRRSPAPQQRATESAR